RRSKIRLATRRRGLSENQRNGENENSQEENRFAITQIQVRGFIDIQHSSFIVYQELPLMAGHSHWANISRKKALIDNKRGKVWSKLAKAIIVAAKMGGGDPDANLRLRYAIDAARAVSMPNDNIARAIKTGTGESQSGAIEETIYEGYGPGGVAVMCE